MKMMWFCIVLYFLIKIIFVLGYIRILWLLWTQKNLIFNFSFRTIKIIQNPINYFILARNFISLIVYNYSNLILCNCKFLL